MGLFKKLKELKKKPVGQTDYDQMTLSLSAIGKGYDTWKIWWLMDENGNEIRMDPPGAVITFGSDEGASVEFVYDHEGTLIEVTAFKEW